MTGLLVSVQNVSEAQDALAGGVDIVDIKDPFAGSLGAASPTVVAQICEAVAGYQFKLGATAKVPVSLALGELLQTPLVHDYLFDRLSYAKVGMAGCSEVNDWADKLEKCWNQLPAHVKPVTVAYADWQDCKAPEPEAIIERGAKLNSRFFLLDTNGKSQNLLETASLQDIDRWIGFATAHNMQVVVAGSVGPKQVELIVAKWRPTFVAVRGAVCETDRKSKICSQKIAKLKQILSALRSEIVAQENHPPRESGTTI